MTSAPHDASPNKEGTRSLTCDYSKNQTDDTFAAGTGSTCVHFGPQRSRAQLAQTRLCFPGGEKLLYTYRPYEQFT